MRVLLGSPSAQGEVFCTGELGFVESAVQCSRERVAEAKGSIKESSDVVVAQSGDSQLLLALEESEKVLELLREKQTSVRSVRSEKSELKSLSET